MIKAGEITDSHNDSGNGITKLGVNPKNISGFVCW
jgi:hypothetical protein